MAATPKVSREHMYPSSGASWLGDRAHADLLLPQIPSGHVGNLSLEQSAVLARVRRHIS